MIQFNASIHDDVKLRMVPEALTSITGYFEVKQCDLVANIKGGSGRAVGQNGRLILSKLNK